jgi:ABC-type transport system substrate-binding protein
MFGTQRRVLRGLAAPIALLTLATAGCGGASSAGSGASDTSVLTLGMTADIVGWDDQPAYQGWAVEAVKDTLLRCDETGASQPGLAREWTFSEDTSSVTAHLRPGVTFSDGSAVDSGDIKASFEHAASKNGRFAGIEIETPDDLTVTITWPTPQPALSLKLCEPRISPSEQIAAGTLDDRPVGSGPYTLDASATTRGSVYTFLKNEDYWDAENFPYERVVMRVLESETAALNALKTGQIDGTIVSQATVDEAQGSGLEVKTLSGGITTRLLLTDHRGEAVPALGDVRVRRAMNMVFDRDAIAEQLYRGHAEPAYQIFRPDSDASIDGLEDPYPYDVEAARELMAEAGYADGFTLNIPFMEGQNLDLLVPYVTDQLGLLNINVQQETLSGPSAIQELLSGDYPVPLWQLGNYGESLQDIQDYVLQDGIWNVMHQPDPTIEDLWQTILNGTDEERVAAQQDINQHIIDQAWFVPMAYPDGFYAHSPDIEIPTMSDYAGLHPLLRDFK